MFSKACEYGIRATIFIAGESKQGRRISLKDISHAIDSPLAFTAKILQSLAKDEIIQSIQGAHGGYEMKNDSLKEITLARIVESIDGDTIYNGCGLGLSRCNDSAPCPVHHRYKIIREDLKQMLNTTTMEELTMDMKNGLSYLKI